LNVKEEIHIWLKTITEDSISKILLKNSTLTSIQLETLLIDILSEKIVGKQIKTEKKAKLRLSKREVSRGSFDRTSKQARKNVVKSIYTIMLLGYLGIFESASLDSFLEIANKVQMYIDVYRDALRGGNSTEQRRIMELLREELKNRLEYLSI